MKRYQWTIGIGPRTVSFGAEDEESVAVDAVKEEVKKLLEDTPGLWAKVEDVTRPYIRPNHIGWKTVFDYQDPRPVADDLVAQGLKRHLREAHDMIEETDVTVADEVVYPGGLRSEVVVYIHDLVHREQRFGTLGPHPLALT